MPSSASGDPYAKKAKGYDAFVEPFVSVLRVIGMKMFPLDKGMSVLDVGCGTGTLLKLYQKTGCTIVGIDASPSMLEIARAKLTKRAELHLGDASNLPFPDELFDLTLAMFILHETPASIRSSVIKEAKRVTKRSGRFLAIDYYPGPARFPWGWLYRIVTFFLELLAGREHFQNYRDFMVKGGLQPLIAANGLTIDKKKIVGGGTAGLYLLRCDRIQPVEDTAG
jgi:ubiquinone/menaquinone biosynthesis C-methylase UbiE